ncbi:hypothetical protein [Streptomyces rapamycinicus]|uniref:Uncharacterized protein n=1 Tax=Streptomyces rapamycinicus TaxID=1226757 RepID=A0ABR6LCY4_9ACTN|nr:hypothetical protein [Streptomyces rapamycinicus]MBB4779403.1 hypothetical protein [Streptomyces rapamycinicus]UTP28179.1 hypothetical protein LIV37_01700 [Streptomyces rapamycinicus NRRL 5491]
MTGSVRLPPLFLDVDGPLIPFGAEPQRYRTYAAGLDLREADANPLLTRINPEHDEVTDTDRAWVAAHHPGHALLHRVDARLGLTDGDYAALGLWLRQLLGVEEAGQQCMVPARRPESEGPPSGNRE